MFITDILPENDEALIKDFDSLLSTLRKESEYPEDTEKYISQYAGDHEILQRQDKLIGDPSEGKTKLVKTSKLVLNFQKKIVNIATAFLFGEPVTLIQKSDNTDNEFNAITDIWHDNKLDYFNRELTRAVCRETRAAELWYITGDRVVTGTNDKQEPVYSFKDGTKRLRTMLLSKNTGNSIYPHYDDNGDMDGFLREYSISAINKTTNKVENRNYAELYMSNLIIYASRGDDNKWLISKQNNPYGKIPVIYFEQDKPEWYDVQTLIDRLEMMHSRHADTNDYFGDPIIKVFGTVANMPDKGQIGKLINFEMKEVGIDGNKLAHGDAEYLTWNQSPESIKLEMENLRDYIYTLTSTPDISFDSVKGLGNVSGIALKLLFLDAILKAKNKEEIYGDGLVRRINLLKQIVKTTNVKMSNMDALDVMIKFNSPLPENIGEIIKTLVEGRAGDVVMSRETAVRNNPYVSDPGAEIESLNKEQKEQQLNIGESYEL